MKTALVLPMCLFAGLVNAATVTVDFESLASPGEGNIANGAHGNTYFEDGLIIRDVDGEYELATWYPISSGYTGSTTMFNNSRNATTRMSAVDGGAFDLLSIDLAPLNIAYNPDAPEYTPDDFVTVTFVANTGHSQTFDVGFVGGNWVLDEILGELVWYTNSPPVMNTFVFDAGFQGVTSVSWIQEDPGSHQFDNIVASGVNVIPIPAAVWLFASALAGLGLTRYKRAR